MLLDIHFCGYFDSLPNPNEYVAGSTCLVKTHVLKCSDNKNCKGKWIFRKTNEYTEHMFVHDGKKWTQ